MLARERQELILRQIRRSGSVRVSELTGAFHVSDMTVRRDLEALARQGLVEKVHGGAIVRAEPGFEAKAAWEPEAKEEIALAAAGLVTPGLAVGLSAGTTTWALARQLLVVPRLTVVTNSLRIADVFQHARRDGTSDAEVVLTGGLRTPSDALVGPVADQSLRALHVDLLFIGCHGIDLAAGLTSPNLAEAETNRTFMRSAGRTVAVADHSKWGIVGLSEFARLHEIDVLVTDGAPDDELSQAAAEQVGRLLLAGPPLAG